MEADSSKKYQVCSKTVMDTSDPSITFDREGISNHYWDFHRNVKPNWPVLTDGHQKLRKIIEKIKQDSKGKEFNCILGLSGGVDSSYMLHLLIKKYGLRPLVFHVDGGWNSEVAVNNINCLVEKLGLDLYTEVVNWEEMKNFQLSMFKAGVPHLDVPQDLAFIGVLYKFANKHGIKHILNGGNISTESVLPPINILYWGTDMVQIKDILKKFGTIKMKSFPFSSIYYHKIYLRFIKGIKVHKPLNYVEYNSQKVKDFLSSEYNWKPYPQKHFESRFTRFFESYWLPTRFNWDMRRIQFSSLILSGQMTRNEALNILEEKPYNETTIKQELNYIAKKLNISVEELNSYHKAPKKYYYDYKNQKRIIDLGARVLAKIANGRRGGAY